MKIRENVSLKALNTFGLDVKARYFCSLHKLSGVRTLMAWQAQHPDLPLLFLGGGSNILFAGDYAGLVVQVRLQALEVLGEDKHYHYIRVGAGNNWHELVRWTVEQGYAGLENLSLIPGTVGAAPMQNIGAYGVEVGEFIESVQVYDRQLETFSTIFAKDCDFSYRHSIFKDDPNRFVITHVTFKLLKQAHLMLNYGDLKQAVGEEQTAENLQKQVIQIRQSKLPDPKEYPNVGSFFKNPIISEQLFDHLVQTFPNLPHYPQAKGGVKIAAGWLIDQSGWKGKRLGVVGMFHKQALVLVNYDQANLADVQTTYHAVQHDVQQKFDILLEPEPVLFDETGLIRSHME